MKIGDKICIVKLPDGLTDDDEDLKTKTVFELCLRRIFPIVGILPVVETGGILLELHVGEVVGDDPCMHQIWIESEFVELIESA